MAEGNGNGAGVSQEEQDERRPTERVILKRASVLVIPEGVEPDKLGEAIRLLMPKAGRRKQEDAATEAWIEVARKTGGSKKAAITAYTGEPGRPDSEVGTFKAPSSTAWKGGLVLEAPPQPLVTARELDE